MGCFRILTRDDSRQLSSSDNSQENQAAQSERAYDTAARFANAFDPSRAGVGQVLDHALGDNFISRVGASHQMEVGLTVASMLGTQAVRNFQKNKPSKITKGEVQYGQTISPNPATAQPAFPTRPWLS